MIRNRLVLYYLFDILLMSSAFAGNPSLLCFAYVITQAYIKDRNQCWSSPATNNFPYSKSLVSSSSPSAPLSLLPVLFSDICDPKDPWELNRLSEVWEPSLTTSSRVGWWAEWRSFWNAYQELKHFPIKKSAVKIASLCLHLSPNSLSYVNHVGLIFTTNRQLATTASAHQRTHNLIYSDLNSFNNIETSTNVLKFDFSR